MCEQRKWDYLHFGEMGAYLMVSARRSDGFFIRVLVDDSTQEKLVKGLKNFESYRSCQCTNKIKCARHKENN